MLPPPTIVIDFCIWPIRASLFFLSSFNLHAAAVSLSVLISLFRRAFFLADPVTE
jgi:hypothetical protein